MARVLIIGASAGIGLHAVEQLLQDGHHVRAFARSADQIGIDHDRLEIRKGDALQADDVASALEDVDVVVQTLGVAANLAMMTKPVRLFSAATEILVSAMGESGVNRLICVTGFGAGDSRRRRGCLATVPFRLTLGRAYDDKGRQEQLIQASNLDWTIVRPVILTSGRLSGRYKVLLEPISWRSGFISRADVAHFLVQQIDGEAYLRRTPVLAY